MVRVTVYKAKTLKTMAEKIPFIGKKMNMKNIGAEIILSDGQKESLFTEAVDMELRHCCLEVCGVVFEH
jgi:hypothetical protein